MSESRDSVLNRFKAKDCVYQASPVGNSIRVILTLGHEEISTFTVLMEESGWYVAEYESRDERPDQFIVAPTGANNDD